MSTTLDAMLDKMGLLLAALRVLHAESDTDLPFEEWVELTAVRRWE